MASYSWRIDRKDIRPLPAHELEEKIPRHPNVVVRIGIVIPPVRPHDADQKHLYLGPALVGGLGRRCPHLFDESVHPFIMRLLKGGNPSAAQDAIARRAATLCVWCELADAEMAAGGKIDIGEFAT